MVVSPTAPSTQIQLRSDPHGIHLHLPSHLMPWEDLWDQLSLRLQASRPFWQGECLLTLWAGPWQLSLADLQSMTSLLARYHLQVHRVQTEHRSTAIAAATLGYCVEQVSPLLPYDSGAESTEPLYLQTTIRSGTEIRHAGTVLLVGDLNPGGQIIAGGDIVVWGRLRGVAHAGSQGNLAAVIMALQLDPTQLRIATQVARAPESHAQVITPEVAYLQDNIICIANVWDYLTVYRAARGSV
jgi:septum site-determining protein MinC